jgi:hypothetical protein
VRTLNAKKGFGSVLLAAFVLSSIQLIFANVPHVILSFCYVGIAIAALGFLTDRPALIYAYVSVALFAQVPFTIDLVRVYLGLPQFIGLVTYDPSFHTLAGRFVDLGVHMLVLPFTLVGLRMFDPPHYASFVKWYVLVLVPVLAISLLVNVNCMRIGCFEPLLFGSTVFGHSAYLVIVTLLGPLGIAALVRMIHWRIR